MACASALAQSLLDFSPAEKARIASHGPWPPAPSRDGANRLDGRPSAVAWGKQLFADPRLSYKGRMACASCHVPAQAFQDGQPTSALAANATRNTPSLLDAGQRRWLGWDGGHDSLWSASLAPMLAESEMAHSQGSLAQLLREQPDMAARYRQVFARPLPADDEQLVVDLAKVLAAYQATLVSPRNAFDRFRDALGRGDLRVAAQYPQAAQRGLRIFVGKANCSVCHAGSAFSNGEFADIGIPFFIPGGADAGRHGGLLKQQAGRSHRLGPFNDAGAADPRAVTTRHVTLEPRNFGEFRVPGLRQLSQTAPYMHNGSLATIEDVVRHYSELDESRLHSDGERILRRLQLTAAESSDLAAFLRTLGRPAR